jgi:hypothetical protein
MIKNLKNYSTDIAASKTVAEVQDILAQSGARGIAFEYDNAGHIESLFFRLQIENGKDVAFKLPAKPKAVYDVLFGDKECPFKYDDYKIQKWYDDRKQQSLNVAWRIMKEWLEVQFTLIKLNQAEAIEIFLPYMVTGENRTLYQDMKENQFKLEGGKPEEGKVE